ncbi:glycosyl hydrolase family 28-related protein [Pelagicoccus sp. SDUM812005]|nr:glycosyl hydrolase family 28-related protein [Pelagicoccus sp. SDUM812005]
MIAAFVIAFLSGLSWGQDDRLSVRDFGALGDGVSEDTAAVAKAIAAAAKLGGATVVFPKGEYLTGSIQLEDKLTLRFEKGATLRLMDGSGGAGRESVVSISGKKDVLLEGEGVLKGSARSGLLRVVDSERVAIRGLSFETGGTQGDGISLKDSREVRIENCLVKGGKKAIWIGGSRNVGLSGVSIEGAVAALEIGDTSGIRVSQLRATSETGLSCRLAMDVELVDVRIDSKAGPQFLFMESRSVVLDAIGSSERSSEPIVSAHDVIGLRLSNCQAESGTKTFLQVLGSQSSGIVMSGNELSQARAPIMVGPDVPDGRVIGAE